MQTPLQILAVLFGLLGLGVGFVSALLWRRRKRAAGVLLGLTAVIWVLLAVLAGVIAMGIDGYRALTKEETAAVVDVVPRGIQEFEARFQFSDGRSKTFLIRGDELYVDAHILKWKPLGNLLGLHTSYKLSRVAGRYIAVPDELEKPRTLYPLSGERPLDMFELRMRYWIFRPFVDAEYGSGTFLHVTRRARLEVRVTTSGLILREAEAKNIDPGSRP